MGFDKLCPPASPPPPVPAVQRAPTGARPVPLSLPDFSKHLTGDSKVFGRACSSGGKEGAKAGGRWGLDSLFWAVRAGGG